MTTKPIIVFVPGAWHTPAAFDNLLPSLHRYGYLTTGISLPSVGVSPGLTSLAPDVTAVRNIVAGLVDLGREVVIVAHSYGAVPASEALEGLGKKEREATGLLGGVIRVVYIAAMVPVKGLDAIQALGNVKVPEEGGPVVQRITHDDGTTSVINAEECFYHDVALEIARYYTRQLRTQSMGVFTTPVTYVPYDTISSAYLFCANDRALVMENQLAIAKAANITLTETLQTSHSPFLSQPEAVVGFIRRVVEGDGIAA